MSISISAVICTHNRSGYLRIAIKSLIDQTLPKEYYEILVIDSASNDNTRQVVRQEFSHLKNLHYFHETTRGIAYARNKGWLYSKSKYICYLDDDEIAPPDWLKTILDVFKTYEPRLCLIGGRIDPIWEVPKPLWLSDKLLFYLSIINFSSTPFVINLTGKFLSTGNMAIPKTLLKEVGGFNTKFSRGEDTALQIEIINRGYACYYHPEIAVKHQISSKRLKKCYFMRWAYVHGFTDAKMHIYFMPFSILKRLKAIMLELLNVLRLTGKLFDFSVQRRKPEKFSNLCLFILKIGRIIGFLTISK